MRTPISKKEFAHDDTHPCPIQQQSRLASLNFPCCPWTASGQCGTSISVSDRITITARLESRLAYKPRAGSAVPRIGTAQTESIGETGVLPKNLQREADRLLPGTILTRIFDDVEHHVLVRGVRDFEYRGAVHEPDGSGQG